MAALFQQVGWREVDQNPPAAAAPGPWRSARRAPARAPRRRPCPAGPPAGRPARRRISAPAPRPAPPRCRKRQRCEPGQSRRLADARSEQVPDRLRTLSFLSRDDEGNRNARSPGLGEGRPVSPSPGRRMRRCALAKSRGVPNCSVMRPITAVACLLLAAPAAHAQVGPLRIELAPATSDGGNQGLWSRHVPARRPVRALPRLVHLRSQRSGGLPGRSDRRGREPVDVRRLDTRHGDRPRLHGRRSLPLAGLHTGSVSRRACKACSAFTASRGRSACRSPGPHNASSPEVNCVAPIGA